jgi:FkbM family methyltransferase
MRILKQKVEKVLARKHPVKYIAMRALKSSRLCSLFYIDRNTYRLRFYPSVLSGELWYNPELRIEDELFFQKYLRPGDMVIDVGANIGALTLQASIIAGQSGTVIAVEPHPRIFQYLMKNVNLNGAANVRVYNCALGNTEGTIRFSDGAMDDTNAVAKNENGLTVPLCRLDNLPIETASIALLKVDVEGFEKFVFEGAERVLKATKCIFFESWEENFRRYCYSSKNLIELLEHGGFSIYRISAPSTAERIRHGLISPICENLVAIRNVGDFISRTGFTIRE